MAAGHGLALVSYWDPAVGVRALLLDARGAPLVAEALVLGEQHETGCGCAAGGRPRDGRAMLILAGLFTMVLLRRRSWPEAARRISSRPTATPRRTPAAAGAARGDASSPAGSDPSAP